MSNPYDTIIKNATIACCDKNTTVYEDGAAAILDKQIAWVGNTADLPSVDAATIIDAKNKLLAPGLVNTHCHLADSLFRGIVEDKELEEWLNILWKAEGAFLNPETNYLGASLGLAEIALSGNTTVLDMFWFPETAAKASKQMGIRMVTGGSAFDLPCPDKVQVEDRLDYTRKFIEEHKDEELITPLVLAHGAYTVSKEHLIEFHQLSKEYNILFHIHAAETKQENKTVTEQHGDRVIPTLAKYDMLGPKTLLAHTVHLSDEEIDTLAKTDTAIVHNPVSNLKIGSGIAQIAKMHNKGIRIGVGTDGAVSGNDIDMFLSLRLTAILQRGANESSTALKARDALHMATLGGAQILGMEDKIGSIEVGKLADLILLDLNVPHAVPLFEPHNHLVLSASKADVNSVWVNGKAVVSNRKLVNEDLDEILKDTRKLSKDIKASIS